MNIITGISNSTTQEMKVVVPSTSIEFDLTLRYEEQVTCWFMSITGGGLTINNIRIVHSGNILFQWYKILKFGIACKVDGGQDPLLVEDFNSGRANLYVLDFDETIEYARLINGQI